MNELIATGIGGLLLAALGWLLGRVGERRKQEKDQAKARERKAKIREKVEDMSDEEILDLLVDPDDVAF